MVNTKRKYERNLDRKLEKVENKIAETLFILSSKKGEDTELRLKLEELESERDRLEIEKEELQSEVDAWEDESFMYQDSFNIVL